MKLPFPPLTLDVCPWAMRRDLMPRIMAASRMAIDPAKLLSGPELAKREPKAVNFRDRGEANAGGIIAVIPLCGVLTPRGSFLSYLFGGGSGSLEDFRDMFAEAYSNPDVGAIVIDIDSPGGQTALTPETAADVAAARGGDKPIIAIANTQSCSGAYWIGSQADEFVVSPSSYVGSVGVYMHHENWSDFETKLGVEHTFVVSEGSPFKVDGNEFEALSDHAQQEWQTEVDELYGMFVSAVAGGRGVSEATVRSDFGKGDVMLAAQAVEAGMADRVATLEDVLAGLITINAPGGGATASALASRVARAAELERKRRNRIAALPAPRAGDEDDEEDEPDDVPDDEPETEPDDVPDDGGDDSDEPDDDSEGDEEDDEDEGESDDTTGDTPPGEPATADDEEAALDLD